MSDESFFRLLTIYREFASGRKLSWSEGLSLRIVGEGCFWKKGSRFRSWKRRVYKLREDGMLFYFDGASMKGSFDVSAVQMTLGNPRNIDSCGAVDMSMNEAVPIMIHSLDAVDAGEGSKEGESLDVVFDNKVAARLFLVGLTEASKKHNVDDITLAVDAIDESFYSSIRSSTIRPSVIERYDTGSIDTRASTSAGVVLLEGNFWKRGRLRDVVKKRVYRVILKRPEAVHSDSKGCIEFDMGENRILKNSFPIYNTIVQFEDGEDGKKGSSDFYENELIGIKIYSCSRPLVADGSNISTVLSSSKNSVVMLLEGVRCVEALCMQLDKVSQTSNIPQFIDLLRSKTISREKARNIVLGSVSPSSASASSTAAAVRKLAPSDIKVVYEGVFLTRTSDAKKWKQRNFVIKRGFAADSAREEYSKHGIDGVSDRGAVVSSIEFNSGALGSED